MSTGFMCQKERCGFNTCSDAVYRTRVYGGVPWVGKGEYSIMKMAMAAR